MKLYKNRFSVSIFKEYFQFLNRL